MNVLASQPDGKSPAMTFPALSAPRLPFSGGLLGRIGARIGNGVRAVQYSRMMQAMSELSDEQLAMLDLTRTDIPRHAHDCVYGTRA